MEKHSDGRTRRSQRSRERIIAAALELLGEGSVSPTAEEIAVRARVGRRTVFRQFNDMERLYQDINLELNKRVVTLGAPLKSSGWENQLQEIMDRRLEAFERFLPFKLASDTHRHNSAHLQAGHEYMLKVMRSVLERVLPPTIRDQKPLLEAIDLALSYEAWQRLRIEQRLCENDARDAVATMVAHLTSAHRDTAPDLEALPHS